MELIIFVVIDEVLGDEFIVYMWNKFVKLVGSECVFLFLIVVKVVRFVNERWDY